MARYTEGNYIMRLLRIKGIANIRAEKLINHFGTCENVFSADMAALTKTGIIPEEVAEAICRNNAKTMDIQIDELNKKGMRFISVYNDEYPPLLKTIQDRPVGLYVMGTIPKTESDVLYTGIIGSRECTDYGLKAAYKSGYELAEYGFVVVSGMAKGIDTMAHIAAMDAGGKTIAVVGSGLDICYPAENKDLMKNIINNGCVISEYPPGTKPLKNHFPERNRIISGISSSIIVVEAEKRSGTSITVDAALHYGRDVFAVPGSIFNPKSVGTNLMIKSGTTPFCGVNDIISEYSRYLTIEKTSGIDVEKVVTTMPAVTGNTQNLVYLDELERRVYDTITKTPVHIDEIASILNINIMDLQAILFNLELYGLVHKKSGLQYYK